MKSMNDPTREIKDDGREIRRLDALHRRDIQNVFGLFALNRAVYGTREGQKTDAVPLDERLQLPQGKHYGGSVHSHTLEHGFP